MQRDLIARDYVVVNVDTSDNGGEKLIERLRGRIDPAPWLAILNSSGKTLATSDGPDGNIGYPADPEGFAHLSRMLRKTSQRLDGAAIQQLIEALP